MRLEPPDWWSRPGWKPLALTPLAFIYGAAARTRFAMANPYRAQIPVICIGNFTLGGAGKTPLAIAVAEICEELGARPAFLTRGYGGSVKGPHSVDAERDLAPQVGDEPLLLARHAPVTVSRNRAEGARRIERTGASVIIMDDGFQNPSLAKDLCIVAVDGGAGLGNARVFPAGPLRAPLAFQARRAGAVVVIGGMGDTIALPGFSGPVLRADIVPADDPGWLRERPVIAFCGIGRPAKFFDTLEAMGATLAHSHPFPDHHVFTDAEAAELLASARRANAMLVTTEKDYVRMSAAGGALGDLKSSVRALPIKLSFSSADQSALIALLRGALHLASE